MVPVAERQARISVQERIEDTLELLAIKPDNWGVYYPPPVDDTDSIRRVCWDLYIGKQLYGGKFGFHIYDWSAIDRATGGTTEKVDLMVTRSLIYTALLSKYETKDFVFMANKMWQPNKGFLRCYFEWQWKDKLWKAKMWVVRRLPRWVKEHFYYA